VLLQLFILTFGGTYDKICLVKIPDLKVNVMQIIRIMLSAKSLKLLDGIMAFVSTILLIGVIGEYFYLCDLSETLH